MQLPRSEWPRALTALESARVAAAVAEVAADWTLTPRGVPTAGLAMLQLRDGAFGEAYCLGEATLSTAELVLELPDGRSVAGAAAILADDADLARDVAVCDAVLAARLPGHERIAELVDEGMAARRAEARVRRAILARTRVDFAVMAPETEDDDAD